MRIGTGFDAHRLVSGRPLFLGSVEIPFEKGLLGHSDADVLLHAIIDALLGAAALGNIGRFFPDTDPSLKDISSLILLEKTKELLDKKGYSLVNIDTVIVLEEPRLDKYLDEMTAKIAETLATDKNNISIKPKTTEKMGFTGKGEGIAAMATVLISQKTEVGSQK